MTTDAILTRWREEFAPWAIGALAGVDRSGHDGQGLALVPTLRVGISPPTLRVVRKMAAERASPRRER